MQVDELKFPVSRSNLRFLLVYRKSNWPFVLCGIIFSSCHMNPTAVISLNATRGHRMRLNLLRGLITLIWNLKIIKVLFSPWFLNVKSLVSKMMQFCGRKSVLCSLWNRLSRCGSSSAGSSLRTWRFSWVTSWPAPCDNSRYFTRLFIHGDLWPLPARTRWSLAVMSFWSFNFYLQHPVLSYSISLYPRL